MRYISSMFYPTFESLKKIPGIYVITNEKTHNRIHQYVGQSVDVLNRYRAHLNMLRKNIHYNHFLQNSFNKHGEDAFSFELLEHVREYFNLTVRETYWINYLGGLARLYNYTVPIDSRNDVNSLTNCHTSNLGESVVNKINKMSKSGELLLMIER